MNRQILDAPFEDETNFLKEGETILWKGQNRAERSNINILRPLTIFEPLFKFEIETQILISSVMISLVTWAIAKKPENIQMLPFLSIVFLLFLIFSVILNHIYFWVKKRVRYYITEHRLIFQYDTSQFHAIKIEDVEMYFLEPTGYPRTFHLQVRNQSTSRIVRKIFLNGERRLVVKLENIKHIDEPLRLLDLN